MDFGGLKENIQSVIGRAPADVCYELVTADINQLLRVYQMEAEVNLTEAATVDLPDDFLDVVSLYRNTQPRTVLTPRPPQTLQNDYTSSGVPQYYSVEDGRLHLSPSPNGPEQLVLRYFSKVSDLSADDSGNVILTNYPAVYIYGVLTHHALLIRDQKAVTNWSTAYMEAKNQARKASNKYRSGAGPMRPVIRSVG